MRCIECLAADLQAQPAMARHGACVCKFENVAGHYQSLTFIRVCEKFDPAPADSVEKRTVWLKAQVAVARTEIFKIFSAAQRQRMRLVRSA
jgi:hypothetical protein